MGHKNKSLSDLESEGFTIYPDMDKPKTTPKVTTLPVQPQQKIIIMDNREVLKAVAESNKQFKESIEYLMGSMSEKPDSFTLDIQRDQHGFMKSIKVKVNK